MLFYRRDICENEKVIVMDRSFEIKTEGIPADYSEAMNILYELSRRPDIRSRFIEAEAVKKSSVKIESNIGEVPLICLGDSEY